jgi:hypothetical protein
MTRSGRLAPQVSTEGLHVGPATDTGLIPTPWHPSETAETAAPDFKSDFDETAGECRSLHNLANL